MQFINDLACLIKSLNCGVQCGDEMVSILLYADDIVVLGKNEQDLQKILFYTNDWCKKWRFSINEKKIEIIHFRSSLTSLSYYQFYFVEKKIDFVKSYKYLGFYVDERMNFVHGSTVLSE